VQDVKYLQNEVYFDIHEEIDCIIDTNGAVLRNDVRGVVLCKCLMSGTPDLTLVLSDSRVIEDAALHPCVRHGVFDREKVVSFVPPDGEFKVCVLPRVLSRSRVCVCVCVCVCLSLCLSVCVGVVEESCNTHGLVCGTAAGVQGARDAAQCTGVHAARGACGRGASRCCCARLRECRVVVSCRVMSWLQMTLTGTSGTFSFTLGVKPMAVKRSTYESSSALGGGGTASAGIPSAARNELLSWC
jgi:hypothetical protein